VSTFSSAEAHPARWTAVRVGFAIALSVLATAASPASSLAQDLITSGCIGSWRATNCVTRYGVAGDPFVRPVPRSNDRARAEQRERRWVTRCQPTIKQDRYGVARYHYAMPGCEFGVGEY
jgi:hypothetical protein